MNRFLPLLFVLMITSCVSNETADSDNVNQSEIYQTYRYNWSHGSYTASVSFRFGGENGTTLRLKDPSEVRYNGNKLKESKFLFGGAFYQYGEHSYSPDHAFVFTDTDGKKYKNSYHFEEIQLKNAPKSILKDVNLEIGLSRKLESSEGIVFVAQMDTIDFKEMRIGTSPEDSVYYDKQSQELVVNPGFFKSFPNGPVTIWLDKSEVISPLEEKGSLPGELHFNYQSDQVIIRKRFK